MIRTHHILFDRGGSALCAGNKHKGQEAVHVSLICIHKTEKHKVISLLLESQLPSYLNTAHKLIGF